MPWHVDNANPAGFCCRHRESSHAIGKLYTADCVLSFNFRVRTKRVDSSSRVAGIHFEVYFLFLTPLRGCHVLLFREQQLRRPWSTLVPGYCFACFESLGAGLPNRESRLLASERSFIRAAGLVTALPFMRARSLAPMGTDTFLTKGSTVLGITVAWDRNPVWPSEDRKSSHHRCQNGRDAGYS